MRRAAPKRFQGEKVPKRARVFRLHGAGDFNADGADELVLSWGIDAFYNSQERGPERWWVTDGSRDLITFTSRPYGTADAG